MLIMRDACLVSKMVSSSEPSNCFMTYGSHTCVQWSMRSVCSYKTMHPVVNGKWSVHWYWQSGDRKGIWSVGNNSATRIPISSLL